jgi:hypothetical protein
MRDIYDYAQVEPGEEEYGGKLEFKRTKWGYEEQLSGRTSFWTRGLGVSTQK